MDIDQELDVPDTPDKDVRNITGKGFIRKENNSSLSSHSRNRDIFCQKLRNPERGRNKFVIHDGSKRLPSRPVRNLSISDKPQLHKNSRVFEPGNSSSSTNTPFCERMVSDKTATHDGQSSICSELAGKGKALITFQSPTCFEDDVTNSVEQSGNAQVREKASRHGSLGNCQTEFRKGSISANGFFSSHGLANSSLASGNAGKGKERVNDTNRVGSSYDYAKRADLSGISQSKGERALSAPFHSVSSPEVSRQKRLVWNGCISPHNIAKAKQLVEKHDDVSEGIVQNVTKSMVSNGSPDLANIIGLVAEEDNISRMGGKRAVNHSFLSKQTDAKATNLSNRVHIHASEKADGFIDSSGNVFEPLDGWRTTHNHMRKTARCLPNKDQHPPWEMDEAFISNQQQLNSVGHRVSGYRSSVRTCNNSPDDYDLVPSQLGSAPSVAQSVSQPGSQLASTERQKRRGSTSSNNGECSTSTNSEIVFLGSSGETSNLRSTGTRNRDGLNILNPVIEIDEFSPEVTCNISHNIGCSSNDVSDARKIQVEADEILARELQQQLYNEMPDVGVQEIDAHVALALQQQENSEHAFADQGRPTFSPRGSFVSNLRRRSQSHSPQNSSVHRGTRARRHASTRMTRLRNRFPGQPRTLISRERSSLFPPNMDVDMRINILEALETFSDMGVVGNFLQVQHEFNENDYEMLLALDDNNHHVGASVHQINSLPQSTVQSDNFEEGCAICLETPTTGDTIRHLPCLHKFHKDCIDPWLSRKTSCPVCKYSIT